MAESQRDEAQPLPEPPIDAGARLQRGREAAGLSRADIAATTKIPERHIIALETGNYGALAGRSYVLGFSRTYARAIGLDEEEIIQAVREELGNGDAAVEHRNAFEPGDPSRVPSKRVAWIAALLAFFVTIAMVFFWRGRQEPVTDPGPVELVTEEAPVEPVASETALPPIGMETPAPATNAIPQAGAGTAPLVAAPVRRAPAAPARAEPARLGGILPPDLVQEPAPAEPPPATSTDIP